MTTDAEAADYLRVLLPKLRPHWEAWKVSRRDRASRYVPYCPTEPADGGSCASGQMG